MKEKWKGFKTEVREVVSTYYAKHGDDVDYSRLKSMAKRFRELCDIVIDNLDTDVQQADIASVEAQIALVHIMKLAMKE